MRHLLIFLLLCLPCLAATYYVSKTGNDTSGDGTLGTPWASIQKGVNALRAGDTLYIRVGTYYESVTAPALCTGTVGNVITISSYQNEEVVIEGAAVATGWAQCTANTAGLKDISGTVNPNYANIYWADIPASQLPYLSSAMMFEVGTRLRIASEPDQDRAFGVNHSLMTPLTAEAFGVKTYVIDSDLNEIDDYWNGCYLKIWLHLNNNNDSDAVISDFEQSTGKMTLASSLPANIGEGATGPDAYYIANHPLGLDTAGEYIHTTTADPNGNYRFFVWPVDTADLTTGISVSNQAIITGISLRSYTTLNGVTVRGMFSHGIYIEGLTGTHKSNISITNCKVNNVRASGVYALYVDDSLVDNCTITLTGLRGVMFNTGLRNKTTDCVIAETYETNVSLWAQTDGRVLRNTLYGSQGGHGQGITIYTGCDDMLIADNRIVISSSNDGGYLITVNAPVTFNTPVDIVFCNNIMVRDGSGNVIQSHSLGTGNMAFFNNVMYSTSSSNMLIAATGNFLFVNNVMGGGVIREDAAMVVTSTKITSKNNLFTTLPGYTRDASDIDGTAYAMSDLFVNATTATYNGRPKPVGPLIMTGLAMTAYLKSWGLRDEYPDYNFTKDGAGFSWESTPSIGAMEDAYPSYILSF
jgi:hypothetical protein